MATLPRRHSSKYGVTIPSPFSTSPRKLQEMSLPVGDGHDVTSASGISMKQYEEQLNGLRKENFQLKLRIYFLEEKLGNGAPPAVQGLLEHNVRLQVEVEEMRRQLTDKQELLAAAAEAIDVLEQQGSLSNDSIEVPITRHDNEKKDLASEQDQVLEKCEENADNTYNESESAGECLITTVNNEDLDELVRLRKENYKALHMIKACMKKIQQQDKEIKRLKLDKGIAFAQARDTQIEKYEEILKCKDEHIKELENKIRDFQNNLDILQSDNASGNLQQLLTRRLQGLAYFLDKLLSHKCVLGEDKKKLAESILEQSLALPVGLKLDESIAPGELTMDESNLDISQSLRMEDLTMMFGHHLACSDDNRYSCKKPVKLLPQADTISESECWSEPDRNVSLARIGLCDIGVTSRDETSEANKLRSRRSRISHGSRSDENKTNETILFEEKLDKLTQRCEILEREKNELLSNLEISNKKIDDIVKEKEDLTIAVANGHENVMEAEQKVENMMNKLLVMESKLKDMESQVTESLQLTEKLRAEKQEIESTYLQTECMLRRAADEATLQASQASLDRIRAEHEKMQVEKALEETREKLANVMESNAQFEAELSRKMAIDINNKLAVLQEGLPSEEDRPTSPDQGIDSDRLSSFEQNEPVALSPKSLFKENEYLKQKLERTKSMLAETLTQLNNANRRKISVQRAICREIHKTQGVLRKARDQLEHQNK